MAGNENRLPSNLKDVFTDFKGRRDGLIKALTEEKDDLSLFAYPDGTWEVKERPETAPPEIPEPSLGINWARKGIPVNDWIKNVALYSDAWLLAVAFYFSSRLGFGKRERNRLFDKINDLPTIVEVVINALLRQAALETMPMRVYTSATGASLCGACGNNYGTEEFWICCDLCDRWFHGTCVNITRAEAEHIEKYKCLTCRNERSGSTDSP
ncbi:PHD finger protein ALFIN-LIKE 6 [Abeliophyllum distichum]|uniref:PHD finger protein ALFIN-LIKE n=1 Tax=Abeliophyllum distichum TaxID=126358 RepID=A0ABD1P9Q9_9LAMI